MFSDGIFYVLKLAVKTLFYTSLVLGAAASIATTETNVKVAVKTHITAPTTGEITGSGGTQLVDLRPQVSPNLVSDPFNSENWEPILVPFILSLVAGAMIGFDFGGFTYPIRARGFKENVRRAKWRVFTASVAAAFVAVAIFIVLALKRGAIPNPEETIYMSARTLMTLSVTVGGGCAILFFYSMWAMVRSIASEDDAG